VDEMQSVDYDTFVSELHRGCLSDSAVRQSTNERDACSTMSPDAINPATRLPHIVRKLRHRSVSLISGRVNT